MRVLKFIYMLLFECAISSFSVTKLHKKNLCLIQSHTFTLGLYRKPLWPKLYFACHLLAFKVKHTYYACSGNHNGAEATVCLYHYGAFNINAFHVFFICALHVLSCGRVCAQLYAYGDSCISFSQNGVLRNNDRRDKSKEVKATYYEYERSFELPSQVDPCGLNPLVFEQLYSSVFGLGLGWVYAPRGHAPL